MTTPEKWAMILIGFNWIMGFYSNHLDPYQETKFVKFHAWFGYLTSVTAIISGSWIVLIISIVMNIVCTQFDKRILAGLGIVGLLITVL